MCGRYMLMDDPALLERAFGLAEVSDLPRQLEPRFNIAPTQPVPIVRDLPGRPLDIVRETSGGVRELVIARWGLIPSWAKDPSIGSRMINARAESVAEKPAFRAAFRARRCLVPASGFFEWARRGSGPKQPYLIRRKDGAPMDLAGLWEHWTDPKTGEVVTSCTILTCAPNALMAELHDRMPVILDPADYAAWLDPSRGGLELLRPCPEAWLEAVPVSTRVNSPRNDDPSILQPEGEMLQAQGTLI